VVHTTFQEIYLLENRSARGAYDFSRDLSLRKSECPWCNGGQTKPLPTLRLLRLNFIA